MKLSKQNKTKHFVFTCNAELGSRSGHCKQVFHLHRRLMDHAKGMWAVNQNVKGKTVTLLEVNKAAGKDLGPKPIPLTGKGDGFYYP